MAEPTFYQVVSAAVADISERGYLSPEQLAEWTHRIRDAAERTLTPPHVLEQALRSTLSQAYARLIERGMIVGQHKDMPRFTLEKAKPKLRAELDRAIMAIADLIKLNRRNAVGDTLQRFAGWMSSVPPGGSKIVDRRAESKKIRKALASLPFEERRVLVDQGHKFSANLSRILATDGGAIGAIWHHHHVRYPRPEHVTRDGKFFLMRDSWAHQRGLVKPGPHGFTDEIEQPAEWVFCRCSYQWIYNLRDCPSDVMTNKGREALVLARAA